MPSSPSPSSSVQAARQALAGRLKELRLDAELSGRKFSERAGWSVAKTSRIERASQPVTAEDIRVWCRVCDAEEHVDDLMAALRAAEGAYVEWRRLQQRGMRRVQQSYVPLYERTRHFRSYQSHVIPGFLQTSGYAEALLSLFAAHHATPNDAAAAAAARLERRKVLYSTRRFAFLLEESVLRYALGGPTVLAGQLGNLLEAMALPSVSLGIIPANLADRPMWTLESFMVFDDAEVHVETLTARVTVTAPSEMGAYVRAFAALSDMAVYGDNARGLITSAIGRL